MRELDLGALLHTTAPEPPHRLDIDLHDGVSRSVVIGLR